MAETKFPDQEDGLVERVKDKGGHLMSLEAN
jgi:hypothetical protein